VGFANKHRFSGQRMSAPMILIAATRTSSGKSTVTLGILRALRNRRLRVSSLKVGPDYIDPGFHAAATSRPCLNLDAWAMRLGTLAGTEREISRDADMVVGEGVMGLFDGAADGTGSTADLAALLGVPVILIVDAESMGPSLAAIVEGFARFRDDVEIAGVILNRVSGAGHARLLLEACEARFSTPVIGWLPRDERLTLARRHLGLVQASEHDELEAFLDGAGSLIETQLDLDRLLRLARPAAIDALTSPLAPIPPLGQRIAVASDAAFAFAYESHLAGWRNAGAEIEFFSPLQDEPPSASCDAVYLPGGYPELHGARLAAARRFSSGLRAATLRGAAVYGECGGYMVLGRSLIDRDGIQHAMTGLLPVATRFGEARPRLGYRRIATLAHSPLGRTNSLFRGHEFHYAQESMNHGSPLFSNRDARGAELGPAGCIEGRVMGSFLHLIDAEDGRAAGSR
jgi:cobyrinic acid a,c-diamide synthase